MPIICEHFDSPKVIIFKDYNIIVSGFSSKPLMCLDEHQDHHNSQLCSTSEGIESVGQQLRQIGDDLDRGGRFRSRSLSLVSTLILELNYSCFKRLSSNKYNSIVLLQFFSPVFW